MPVLNDASAIALGSQAAAAVYQGEAQVWPPPSLLSSALWHVDAGTLTAGQDGLADLTGGANHALFDATGPRVLPWSGESYFHFPSHVSAVNRIEHPVKPVANTGDSWTLIADVMLTHLDQHGLYYDLCYMGSGSANRVGLWRFRSNESMWLFGNGSNTVVAPNDTNVVGVRAVLRTETTEFGIQLWEDDVSVVDGTFGTPEMWDGRAATDMRWGGNTNQAQSWNAWSLQVGRTGEEPAYIITADQVSADYMTVQNTGSVRDVAQIMRLGYAQALDDDAAATASAGEYGLAVVDRPLLLFGVSDGMTAVSPVAGGGTRIRQQRSFPGGTPNIGPVVSVHDGSAPSLSGTSEEYVAEAIWDRVLSPAEVDRAAAELLAYQS